MLYERLSKASATPNKHYGGLPLMAGYTLDDIRAQADAKYGSFDVTLADGTVVVLRNALRMPKPERDSLVALQERKADDMDESTFEESLIMIAANKAHGRALVDEIGGDMAVLAALFEAYQESTQAGEASASAA